jgi:hypothetical protein
MDVYLSESKDRRKQFINIAFQEGPIGEVGVNGCHIEDVIDHLIERLRGFNEGDLRCRENSLAITALEEAGLWLLKRRMNRLEQGVEGTYQAHKS